MNLPSQQKINEAKALRELAIKDIEKARENNLLIV